MDLALRRAADARADAAAAGKVDTSALPPRGAVVVAVGGGGKTSALFALAAAGARRGLSAALTTTTHIRDPRREAHTRSYDAVLLDAGLALPPSDGFSEKADGLIRASDERGAVQVIASRELPEEGKLAGIHPLWISVLSARWDLVLVEADGSRGLPVKAPAAHEPVLPPAPDLVLGMVGLDCLGRPMDGAAVHRPELFGPLVGCASGAAIGVGHLAILATAREGLFKGAGEAVLRILVLNKADLVSVRGSAALRSAFVHPPAGADAVLLCSVAEDWVETIGGYPP